MKSPQTETPIERTRWPFLGWMSIVEMQQHIKELRDEVERLEAQLKRKLKKRPSGKDGNSDAG